MTSARTKFLIGGVVILGTAGWLMSGSIKDTMVYFLTPEELHAKVVEDPTIRDIGVKVGAKVVGGSIVRLGTKSNSAGGSTYPASGDPSVSVRGLVPAAGATRSYQVWYRNAAAFCTTSTFNLSNGVSIIWS